MWPYVITSGDFWAILNEKYYANMGPILNFTAMGTWNVAWLGEVCYRERKKIIG
jgi:hypothetical protein